MSLENYPKIHSILDKQTPDRKELRPDKKTEMDFDYAEGPETTLAIDFDELLQQKQELESKTLMDKQEILKIFREMPHNSESINKNFIDQIYKTVMERIRKETNFLHEFDEIQRAINMASNGQKHADKIEIKWGADDLRGALGEYIHTYDKNGDRKREIKIQVKQPGHGEILMRLALRGRLPVGIEVFMEEVTHSLQSPDLPDLDHIKDNLKGILNFTVWRFMSEHQREIRESQGYRISTMRKENKSFAKLFQHLQKFASPGMPMMNDEKILYSIEAIDKLSALGFGVEEMAEIVRDCGLWSKQRAMYPRVEEAIESKRKQMNISEGDVESLVMADKIGRDIEKIKVMLIAQEELKKCERKITK
ncbi:MAG: hypothetical protein AAB723_02645 [Patescibacteria group bacterium]